MSDNSKTPLVFATVVNGVLLLLAVVMLLANWNQVMKLDIYHGLVIVLLFAGLFGLHGLLHTALGSVYGTSQLMIPRVGRIPF
jgi:hypothetical protein